MNPQNSPSYYLVIDLEATCSEPGRVPSTEREIIEIGAVLVDATSLQPLEEFQSFVRPVRHPVLTEFCSQLTSITQGQVDEAPEFPEVLAAFRRFIEGRRPLFCSWGDFDRRQLQRDCQFHQVEYPFGEDHLNLKVMYSEQRGERQHVGMARALKQLGLNLDGTHHRGIDDARNIARLLPFIVH